MALLKTFPILLFFLINANSINTQDLQSPCPRLFVYENRLSEPGKWYGTVTLLSGSTLSGVYLRLIFDKYFIQLGNWFGEVVLADEGYLIRNHTYLLKAHVPVRVLFFVKYNPREPVPQLKEIRLNAKTVCPEGDATEEPTGVLELQTSIPLGASNYYENYDVDSDVVPTTVKNIKDQTRPTPGHSNAFAGDVFSVPKQTSQETPEDNVDLNSICGTVVAPQPTPLIAYGEATHEGEFPWHAAIYYANSLDLTYRCGASLISRYYVITVAHCVVQRRSKVPLKPENMVIYLGKYYLKRFSSPGTQDRDVEEITPHPQYNFQTYDNDIALVKFTTAARITSYVRPICLWRESTDIKSVIKKLGSVVGWGYDETGQYTEQLMQARMPVVANEMCIASFPEFYTRFTHNNSYCAGSANGTTVCNGDAGGGMVFLRQSPKKPNNAVWQLRGLTSIGTFFQNLLSCDVTRYAVFTDVAKYLDWIRKSIKEP